MLFYQIIQYFCETNKKNERLDAYGTIDELNSFIGLLTTYDLPQVDSNFLQFIQNRLFSIGSYLATDVEKVDIPKIALISDKDILNIESEIDRLDDTLPVLRQSAEYLM